MRASDHLPDRWNAAEHFVGRHVAEGRGARVALVAGDETVSYADLDGRVRRFAGALLQAGVHRGDRVALALPDGPLLAAAFWGTLAAGAVAVPLNPALGGAELDGILEDCAPHVVVGEARGWSAAEAAARLAAAPPADYAPTHRDGFAYILYSSGTTGAPKGVVHLARDAWVCARAYGQGVLGVGPDDRVLSVARMFFAYGLGNSQLHVFHAGASAVLCPERMTPAVIFREVRRHRPTLLFAVPTSYAQMLAAMDGGAEAELGGLRLCVSAGEALPAALLERWRARTGLLILDGLGTTEAGHTFLSNRAEEGGWRAGSCGRPVPGYDVRVVDEHGADAAAGDLLVRGDSIMALYWNRPEASRRALAGEWLRTGDKVTVDGDGFHWHAGRGDDLMKVAGMWVAPVELEAALAAHPAVLECAVVGRPNADGLIRPHAVVVLRPGAAAAEAELIAFAGERLPGWKCPRTVAFADELPRTATGKLRRFLLR